MDSLGRRRFLLGAAASVTGRYDLLPRSGYQRIGFLCNEMGAFDSPTDRLPKIVVRYSETQAIQDAIDEIFHIGGGRVVLREGKIKLQPSTLSESFYNGGDHWAALQGCLVLRSGVYLEGAGIDRTILIPTEPIYNCIMHISPQRGGISDLSIDGGWSAPTHAAGHGIVQLLLKGGEEAWCRDVVYRRLCVRNVASYGLGIQNGDVSNVMINNIQTVNTGADGIDTKQRGPGVLRGTSCMSNIIVSRSGQRLKDSAGIDIRGQWELQRIQVKDIGREGADLNGVRFRSPGPGPDDGSTLSSLRSFRIEGTATGRTVGVSVGSPFVRLSQGEVWRVHTGVQLKGNLNGSATHGKVEQILASHCAEYGFEVLVGCDYGQIIGCTAVKCVKAGFRNAGRETTLKDNTAVNCGLELSSSRDAARSQKIQSNKRR